MAGCWLQVVGREEESWRGKTCLPIKGLMCISGNFENCIRKQQSLSTSVRHGALETSLGMQTEQEKENHSKDWSCHAPRN